MNNDPEQRRYEIMLTFGPIVVAIALACVAGFVAESRGVSDSPFLAIVALFVLLAISQLWIEPWLRKRRFGPNLRGRGYRR